MHGFIEICLFKSKLACRCEHITGVSVKIETLTSKEPQKRKLLLAERLILQMRMLLKHN
jgi:hypothetical protein